MDQWLKQKKALWMLAIVFLLWMGSGCDAHSGKEDKGSASSQKGEASEVIRIGYQKYGTLNMLKARGNLEKRLKKLGYTVQWSLFPGGPQLLEAMNAGSLDFGHTGEAPPVFAQAAGTPLLYVATTPPNPAAEAILVPKNSPIRTIADLKGKKVALNKGSNVHYLLVQALEKAGLKLSDIQPVYLPPADARAAFEQGSVDAWVIWDPFLADAEVNGGARILMDAKGLPKQYGFIVGRNGYVKQYADVAKTVIAQLNKVHQEIHSSPDEAAKLLAKETKIGEEIWKRTLSRRGYGVFPLTKEVVDAQQRIADRFYEAGVIPKRVKVEDAVVVIKGQ
ncbi:sulfonate ABC transporter substrate-binding protein [Geobacillus sp. CAMR5420]|nr:sulfonate ABC transporter substrate-binding protein [Geobacillus sp. CAMR5420]AMQ21380.1 ABC transporter substrate-binding protein [Geobacillus sp. JS12]KDE47320.1 ABC transporter substrate-binding protein [Geobacillus sp. CAMR5420]